MFRIINYNKLCSFGAVLDEGFNGDPFVKLPWEARVLESKIRSRAFEDAGGCYDGSFLISPTAKSIASGFEKVFKLCSSLLQFSCTK